jgi:flagellar biosynthesis anti-sigma factor FlgM
MVDSVTFGQAKPVPARRSLVANEVVRSATNDAKSSATATHSLSLASALAQKGPPFDADKVASLRAAIASGRHQINLGNIADGIISFGLSDHA